MKKVFITKTDLAKRWSMSLIDKYYPQCDEEKPNPHHKYGSPMQLYDVKKVARIESKADFKADLCEVNKRKIAAVERAKRQRDKLISYANGVQIVIPTYNKDKLIQNACHHYNWWNEKAYDYATPSSDESFLKRITINYLRHQCTQYDKELKEFYGKVGVKKAHDVLQSRINEAIKQKYEWLR